jgi:RNA polymerase sigma-70 factor (ECF subfamily)
VARFRAKIGFCAPAESTTLATPHELSEFLKSVERRAYKQAQFAVGDGHLALDVVQEAMLKLVARYADKPVEELPLLFQRILQNAIRDHYRRQKVRNLWVTLFSSLAPKESEAEHDPLETLEAAGDGLDAVGANPATSLEWAQTLAAIEEALQRLPLRQRQAFLLRYWEGLDVEETAKVIGCSAGSVKTHCSRAAHALAQALKAKGIEP